MYDLWFCAIFRIRYSRAAQGNLVTMNADPDSEKDRQTKRDTYSDRQRHLEASQTETYLQNTSSKHVCMVTTKLYADNTENIVNV